MGLPANLVANFYTKPATFGIAKWPPFRKTVADLRGGNFIEHFRISQCTHWRTQFAGDCRFMMAWKS